MLRCFLEIPQELQTVLYKFYFYKFLKIIYKIAKNVCYKIISMKIYSNNKAFDDIVNGIADYAIDNGIECTIVNGIMDDDDDIYVLFGLNNFTEHSYLPKNYIAVQLEQSGVPNTNWFTPLYFKLLNGAIEVWDYSIRNVNNLKKHITVPLVYVPLLYMKHLTYEERLTTKKDIDILFMGAMNKRREDLLNKLRENGLNVYMADTYNLWNEERDNIVKRSKILLNIHYYESAILETARLSYALSLGECFVVSEPSMDKLLDKEYSKIVDFGSNIEEIVKKCKKILEMSEEMLKMRINTNFAKYKINNFKINLDILIKYSKNLGNNSNASASFLVPHMDNDGKISLPKLSYEDLPYVSVVTITKNRRSIFELPIRNFYEFEYPKDKLEWVIIDDGDDNLKSILPVDKRIKYVRYTEIGSLCQKRDIGVQQASYETIAFMDDDDYYFPCSIYSRVALMNHYRRDCIGCTQLGIYDIVDDSSFLNVSNTISEASMAFTKEFWKKRQFGKKDHNYGEAYVFINGREKEVINMPYFFNLIAITHKENITKDLRKNKFERDGKMDNFFNLWDSQTQLFFLGLIKKNAYLLQ